MGAECSKTCGCDMVLCVGQSDCLRVVYIPPSVKLHHTCLILITVGEDIMIG